MDHQNDYNAYRLASMTRQSPAKCREVLAASGGIAAGTSARPRHSSLDDEFNCNRVFNRKITRNAVTASRLRPDRPRRCRSPGPPRSRHSGATLGQDTSAGSAGRRPGSRTSRGRSTTAAGSASKRRPRRTSSRRPIATGGPSSPSGAPPTNGRRSPRSPGARSSRRLPSLSLIHI